VTKNVEMLNNLIELKQSTETIKQQLTEQKLKTSQIYHDSALVEPELAPDFKKRLESSIVFNESKFSLECIAIGTRPFTIKWLKNGNELTTNNDYVLNFAEKTGVLSLVINHVSMSDNALFSCRVSNELGMAETIAYINVKCQS